VFLIVNNGGYRALDEFAPRFGVSRPPGTRLRHLDFCDLARAQGVRAERVERADALDTALIAAFTDTKPALLDVRVAD